MTHCILFAVLTLVGLGFFVHLVRRHRWHSFHHGCGGHFHPPMRYGPRWMLRALFGRLGTSVAQEKVIVEALEGVRSQGRKLWDEWRQAKADVAEALRAETLDAQKVEGAFARQDGLMAELRRSLLEAMGKVHGVLDPEQRRELAALLENPHAMHGCC
jgi:uncharacterized membrane protein